MKYRVIFTLCFALTIRTTPYTLQSIFRPKQAVKIAMESPY